MAEAQAQLAKPDDEALRAMLAEVEALALINELDTDAAQCAVANWNGMASIPFSMAATRLMKWSSSTLWRSR